MSFPPDLRVLPRGECSLCKPNHPPESSRTRDPWDPSLISQGTPPGTTLKSIPRPGLATAFQRQERGCEHLPWVYMQGKHGMAGAPGASPVLRVASQETNAAHYFCQETKPVVVIQFQE